MTVIKAACVQMTSGPDISENLSCAAELVKEAAGLGARLIATPENTCHMRSPIAAKLDSAPAQDDHPGVSFFSNLARELGVWLLIGSMSVKLSDDKLFNRSFLFSDQGALVATYDKIHMFDARPGPGESYTESETIRPGERAVVAAAPFAKLGLSICYDVRFAHLYRDLAKAGAHIMMVPAAFAVPTGRAHWDVLLRARAIETGRFVMAPGQVGEHQNGRMTWGHSMIIGPWGEILAEMQDKPGLITADLNLEDVAKARRAISALEHDRDYDVINIG